MRPLELLAKWLSLYLPTKHYLVPKGFDTPTGAMEGKDPMFLTEMARSMQKCPVIYEDIHNKIKRRQEQQRQHPPIDPKGLESWKNRQVILAIEVAFAHEIMMGPANAAEALRLLKKSRDESEEIAANRVETWDGNTEGTKE